MAAKKQSKAPKSPRGRSPGRATVILDIPEELLVRVERYADEMVKADAYRQRSRNSALLVLIDAGLEAKAPK